jgi:hypothetical protein
VPTSALRFGTNRAPACGVLKRGGSWKEGLNLHRGARFIFYGLIWFDLVRLAPKDIGSGVWLYLARLGWMGLDYQRVAECAEFLLR